MSHCISPSRPSRHTSDRSERTTVTSGAKSASLRLFRGLPLDTFNGAALFIANQLNLTTRHFLAICSQQRAFSRRHQSNHTALQSHSLSSCKVHVKCHQLPCSLYNRLPNNTHIPHLHRPPSLQISLPISLYLRRPLDVRQQNLHLEMVLHPIRHSLHKDDSPR